jgi:dynein heavy chain
MNPGYAGRQELPENLKALFRGVAMMAPDRQTIMRVKLAAAGYQEAAPLARKFAALYAAAERQLSKAPHYDFGLRNILAVLRTAGASKRAAPGAAEAELMMRTLRDMNASKLTADDAPLFLALIEDLFPGRKAPRAPPADVAAALAAAAAARGLQPHAPWLAKALELHETALVGVWRGVGLMWD